MDWGFLANDETANDNFQSFRDFLFNLFDECFPLKTRTVINDSEPWYSENLSVLKRKKCREYAKHRKSEKYLSLEKAYKAAIYKAKHDFAAKNLHNLKISKPRQWYSQLKKLIR